MMHLMKQPFGLISMMVVFIMEEKVPLLRVFRILQQIHFIKLV